MNYDLLTPLFPSHFNPLISVSFIFLYVKKTKFKQATGTAIAHFGDVCLDGLIHPRIWILATKKICTFFGTISSQNFVTEQESNPFI